MAWSLDSHPRSAAGGAQRTGRAAPRRAVLTACASAALLAQAEPNPDASLWIEELRIGLFGHIGSVGGGRLRFRDEVHPFTVSGLTSARTGLTRVRAQGEAFGLRRLDDFPGRYSPFQGGAAGDGLVEVHWLRNARGVRLRLRSARDEAPLAIVGDGLVISLDA